MQRIVLGIAGGIAVAAAGGCFKARSSKGGGQISEAKAEKAAQRSANPYDIDVPPGYRIELVAEQLTFPTGVAFGDKGEI